MITIAYRNGIIAADTGLTAGGGLRDGQIEKITKNKEGAVVGCSGEAWWITAFLKWFTDGGAQPHIPTEGCSLALMISKKRKVTLFESEKGVTCSYEIKVPYTAIGSGRHVALGAMFAGANVISAVRAAMAHNESTYGRVQSLKVGW